MTDASSATTGDPIDETTLVLTQEIGAPPEVVFDFFVDPEKMLRWMGTEANIEPRPGGVFWLNVNGSDKASGSYLEVDRPHRVVFTWGWEESEHVPPGSSTVTITLTGDRDSTMLELRHDGLPGGSGDEHRDGWTHFVAILVSEAEMAVAGD